jgi:two-component system sensor histidine kinase BaeS
MTTEPRPVSGPDAARPLDAIGSIKVKLGLLVVASVVAAALIGAAGAGSGVPLLLALPVAIALALGVTQLLAAGMVAPLREMTTVAQAMARGDYSGRIETQASDEVGRLAKAFNSMADDLATVDRERRELVATVSHEIRTPLAGLTALLENLADGVVPTDGPHLADALEQAERLGALVSDLLELSRLDAGTARLDVQPIVLRDLVTATARAIAAGGRDVRVDVQVPEQLSLAGDPMRLRQLVSNLLDNAARHGPSGGTVLVTGGAVDGEVWLEVADSGPGVAPADRERAFERFGTLADSQVGGGTGLGLAIARWVATLHGGSLRFVDPTPGHAGARLRLELPATASDPPLTEEIALATATPATPAPSGQSAPAASAPGDGSPPVTDALFNRFWPEPEPRAGLRVVLLAAGVGVLAGALMAFALHGLSWTVVLLAAGATAFATARRRREPFALACAGLSLLLLLPMMLLDNDAVVALCAVASGAVFLIGVTGAWTLPGFLVTGLAWPLSALRGLPWLGRSLRVVGGTGRSSAVARTVAWSAVGLVVFGALFASADALFAEWVDVLVPNLSLGALVLRGFVAAVVFGLTLTAAYLALNPPNVEPAASDPPPLRNRFEWLVPVLLVDAVFVVFLAAQAAVVFGGHDYLERTTGITYADYVHEGFGQLTVATALTLLVAWAASRRAGRSRVDQLWLRGALGALCLLTLVVVASALYRMHVYQEAYGYTTLRLIVDVFEGWLGLVVLAVMVAGVLGRRRWLPRIALVTGAVALLGLAAVNPDAWVADRNIDRWEAKGTLDLSYLASLSADAAPVIADRLPAEIAACALQRLPLHQLCEAHRDDWLEWNLGRQRAEEPLDELHRQGALPVPIDSASCETLTPPD